MNDEQPTVDLAHSLRRDRRPGLSNLTQQVLAIGQIGRVGCADSLNQAAHQKLIKIIKMRSNAAEVRLW